MAAPSLPYLPDVYRAICQVQKAISKDGISKVGRNQQQGYSFRGIDDIMNALSALLAGADLCILPRMLSRTQQERETAKGGTLFYVTVQADFDFVSAIDGTRHTVTMFGEAMDSADKATNKAMSAAYKYACLQVFCIPTEGMADADSTTHQPAPKHTPAQQRVVEAKLAPRKGPQLAKPQPAAAIAETIPEPEDEDRTRYTWTPAQDEPTDIEIQLHESIVQAENARIADGRGNSPRYVMMEAFTQLQVRYAAIGFLPTFGAILGRYCVKAAEDFPQTEQGMAEARCAYKEMSLDVANREARHAQKWGKR